MRFKLLAIYLVLFSLVLVTPYLTITGFDIIRFDSGGEGELIVTPDPPGTVPTIEIDISPTPSPSGGGSGLVSSAGFSIDPLNFNINLIINTNILKEIIITNFRSSPRNLQVTQEGLDGLIILE